MTELTGQARWTGLVAAAAFIPIGVLSPVGGAIADRFDRRRLLLGTTIGEVAFAVLLAVLVGLWLALSASYRSGEVIEELWLYPDRVHLRRCEAHTLRIIHRVVHVRAKFFELFVEFGNGLADLAEHLGRKFGNSSDGHFYRGMTPERAVL